VLDAARARGFIAPDKANPARWKGHIDKLLPKRGKAENRHHAAMPYAVVPAFIERLRGCGDLSARCLELIILTGVRSGEARGATWSEIDLDARIWTIPALRMKARKEHRVPLSSGALAVLERLPRVSDCVFPGGRGLAAPLTATALAKLLKRIQVPVTTHGFRSSFRDFAGDETSFPREVAEAALAHTVGNAVEAAYRRGDALEKRRALMQSWSDYCTGAATRDNVVVLRAAAE
jgi:integrase